LALKQKAPQYTTPAGEFVWPWLNKYDDRPIKGKPQKAAYKLSLRYAANNPAWLKMQAKLDELVEAAYVKAVEDNPKKYGEDAFNEMSPVDQKKVKANKIGIIERQYPYAPELGEDNEETGHVVLKLKQNAFFKDKKTGEEREAFVALFDASGRPIDRKKVMIYGGSTGVASFTTRPYLVDSTNGAGISLDLKAVQVLQLVTSSQRSAGSYGFAAQDGYSYEGTEDETTEDSETSTETDETDATDF
jgi:hypothetical protein